MSNVVTSLRLALVAHLKANLQKNGSVTPWADEGAIKHVKSGERDGEVKDRKLAVVFSPGLAEDSDVDFIRPVVLIRAWLPKPKLPRTQEPPDPEPLEQLALDLMSCLQPVQEGLVADVAVRLTSVQIDSVDWGVQATLTVWTWNPAVLA